MVYYGATESKLAPLFLDHKILENLKSLVHISTIKDVSLILSAYFSKIYVARKLLQ